VFLQKTPDNNGLKKYELVSVKLGVEFYSSAERKNPSRQLG
jgi:hypothetical protein